MTAIWLLGYKCEIYAVFDYKYGIYTKSKVFYMWYCAYVIVFATLYVKEKKIVQSAVCEQKASLNTFFC